MRLDRGAIITFRKEIKTSLRDRRTLYSTVILPLILPLFMFLPMYFGISKSEKAKEKPTRVILLNRDLLPDLPDFLSSTHNISFLDAPDPESWVREEKAEVVLRIERIEGDTLSWKVVLSYDPLRTESKVGYEKVQSALLRYSSRLTEERLKELGVPKGLVRPILIEKRSVASPREVGGEFVGFFIAILVIIAAYSGGMATAIDATAGEKERKTLEVLLSAPVRRNSLVMGKFLAASLVAFLSVVLTLISVSIVGSYVAPRISEGGLPFSLSVDPWSLLIGSLVLVLTLTLIVALEIAIGIFARTYREAQSYMTPFVLILILPVFLTQFLPSTPPTAILITPILNTVYVLKAAVKGHSVLGMAIPVLVANFIYSLIAIRLAFRMFRNERAILR